MRFANIRSASGGIAWSSVATRYHVGCDFHAGTPITSSNVLIARHCWTAYMTRALAGSTSAAKCATKSSSGIQANPLLVDDQVRQRRGRRAAAQSGAQRFALVQAEGGDIDEADDVRGVGAERCHDLPAIGVSDDDRRTALTVQDLPQPGDVVGQRSLRKLRGDDGVPLRPEALHDGAPARPVGPRAVHQHDVWRLAHVLTPSSRMCKQPDRDRDVRRCLESRD